MIASLLHDVEPNLIAGILCVVLVAIPAALWRWLKKHVAVPLQEVPAIVERQEAMQIKLDKAVEQIDLVSEQVHANHGTSLRDSTNRNEVLTRALAEHVGVDPDELVPPMPAVEAEPVR